jgi:CHAD domain-containing protein
MNSGFRRSNGHGSGIVQPHWNEQLEAWRTLLAKCGRKPTRKRVHGLRVATLRLQALIGQWLKEHLADDAAGRAATRWMKQAEKLRKALSPLRDGDVYLEKVEAMRSPETAGAREESRSSEHYLKQVEALERKLKRKRDSAEKEMKTLVERRHERLKQAGIEMEERFADPAIWLGLDSAAAVREIVEQLASEAPIVNATTLHEFRKRAKNARYLAELTAERDPIAAQQADLLKQIQGTAGEWHDWQTLFEKAQDVIGGTQESQLTHMLETLADRSLQKALLECRRATEKLVALNGSHESSPIHGKLPVRRVESATTAQRREA